MKQNVLFINRILLIICHLILLSFASASQAVQVAGVNVPTQVKVGSETLKLQGVGIRSKYIFDVYIGSFYASGVAHSAKEAIAMQGAKRMSFYFLRGLSRKQLTNAWKEGFQANHSPTILQENKNLINHFVDLFDTDMGKGDIMVVDYIPSKGTQVSINGKTVGMIPEEHFYSLVLSIWMGEHPPSNRFKKALLNFN